MSADRTQPPAGKRLWEKNVPLDEAIHRFTVGDDPTWDRYLVLCDCLGSAAHARTLRRAKLLTDREFETLIAGLAEIADLDRRGAFEIPPALEDCHTAIEAFLTERYGEPGRKIHAGRSRNDQVAAAMRLFMRRRALGWFGRLRAFIESCLRRIEQDGSVPMPGYTHLQAAMPSSVGLWLHAWAEAALEQLRATLDLQDRLDCCPLGTAAGFGSPIELDRAYTAALLGFSRVQRSPIDVQNSRGRMERYFVRVAADVAAIFEKLASDLLLFSTEEFGFFRLPVEFTTGSSIMPQKRNPDVVELLRARAARLPVRLHELETVSGKLPSSYHRDLQLTKEPTIRAALELDDMFPIATRLIDAFAIDRGRLASAMKPELYATHAAMQLVRDGVPFREAYKTVAEQWSAGGDWIKKYDLDQVRRTAGRVAPETLDELRADLARLLAQAESIQSRIDHAERELLPPR